MKKVAAVLLSISSMEVVSDLFSTKKQLQDSTIVLI